MDTRARRNSIADNNQVTGSTTCWMPRFDVLYVEGYPRWEYRYLKNELIREKSVRVATLLLSADEGFAQEGSRRRAQGSPDRKTWAITRFPDTAEEMRKYDVLLIGDVDPTFFSPTQMRLILDFVRKDGGGLGWIAGTQFNPDAYKGTPLDVLLPIIPDDPNHPTLLNPPNEGFDLVMTPAGKESGLFRFENDPAVNEHQLAPNPEMYWYKPVLGLQPAAEVLAVHPTRTEGGMPVPLIVTERYAAAARCSPRCAIPGGGAGTWGSRCSRAIGCRCAGCCTRARSLEQNKRIELAAESNRVEVGQADQG